MLAGQTLEHTETLVVCTCPSCFAAHAIPRPMHDDRLENGGSVYCPNGHSWHFTDPELPWLKRRLAAAQTAAQAARDQAQSAERRRAAAQGQVTKIRNRVGNGVCPCCNRSFAALARHMARQHPDFRGAGQP